MFLNTHRGSTWSWQLHLLPSLLTQITDTVLSGFPALVLAPPSPGSILNATTRVILFKKKKKVGSDPSSAQNPPMPHPTRNKVQSPYNACKGPIHPWDSLSLFLLAYSAWGIPVTLLFSELILWTPTLTCPWAVTPTHPSAWSHLSRHHRLTHTPPSMCANATFSEALGHPVWSCSFGPWFSQYPDLLCFSPPSFPQLVDYLLDLMYVHGQLYKDRDVCPCVSFSIPST